MIVAIREMPRLYAMVLCMEMTFDFGVALMELQNGKRVQRLGWNGKVMFVSLFDENHSAINRAGDESKMLPFLALRLPNGDFVPWTISQADALAEDWIVCQNGA